MDNYETAKCIFEDKYEMDLFNTLKAGEFINGVRLYHLRKKIIKAGVPADYAEWFVRDQIKDMLEQISE